MVQRSGLFENKWKATYTQSTALGANEVKCEVCRRMFRRTSDLKRHKCSSERQKPVCEQYGAIQCAYYLKKDGSTVKETWHSTDVS